MTFFGWFRRDGHAPARGERSNRRVKVDVTKVKGEAFGPITDATRQQDRQRIAEQVARDHGKSGLFG